MKRSIIAIAFALFTTASFAASTNGSTNNNGDINSKTTEATSVIKTSFRQDFQNARLMSTEVFDMYTKLTFKMNDQVRSAYYSGKGELLATTRNIVSSQLPVSLLNSLKKYYNTSWITDLFEFNGDTDNCYYITLENADARLTLRSNGDSWDIFTSTKK